MRLSNEVSSIVIRGLPMSKSYRYGRADQTWRISNDELQLLMTRLKVGQQDSLQELFRAITPLLIAIYEGQAQAGRLGPDRVGHLVQLALLAVYRKRATCHADQPFRAWLIDIARSTMVGPDHRAAANRSFMVHEHLHNHAIHLSIPEPERLLHEVQVAWLAHA